MIKIVCERESAAFERECNSLLSKGWKLLSSHCGYIPYRCAPYGTMSLDFLDDYKAIFILNQNCIKRLFKAFCSAILATGCDGNDVENFMEKK